MRKRNKVFPGLLLPFIFVMLGACVSIKSEVWVAEDGSGKVETQYRMPVELIEWLKQSEFGSQAVIVDGVEIPERLSEACLRQEISDVAGLRLSAYKVTQSGNDVYISFTIEFRQAEDVSYITFIPPVSIDMDEETTEFSQSVCMQSGIDAENSDAAGVYKDYKNTFILHAPREITAHNLGTLEADGRTLIFEYELLSCPECEQVLRDTGDGQLTASW